MQPQNLCVCTLDYFQAELFRELLTHHTLSDAGCLSGTASAILFGGVAIVRRFSVRHRGSLHQT